MKVKGKESVEKLKIKKSRKYLESGKKGSRALVEIISFRRKREHLFYCIAMIKGKGTVIQERCLWISVTLQVSYISGSLGISDSFCFYMKQ